MKRRALQLGALCTYILACGTPDRGATYDRAFAAAQGEETHGKFQEAAASYFEASKGAKIPRDGAHAEFLGATMLERAGDIRGAITEYDKISRVRPKTDDAANAAYHAAELRIANGAEAEGWRAIEQVARDFPESGVGRIAVTRLARRAEDQGGAAAAMALLDRLTTDLGATDLGETIAYRRAGYLETLGKIADARGAYADIATRWPYPYGVYFDDSLFHASLLDEKLGSYQAAIDDLERMLKERESSAIVGSYERPRYDEAALRIATLYDERLHDHEHAREALHRLYADFPTSLRRADALWREAALFRADGDAKSACDRMDTLVDDFPDSRYVPCAVAACPEIARPKKSKAPATCHAYLTRAPEAPDSAPSATPAPASGQPQQ